MTDTLGDRLRVAREAAGFTLEQAGEILDWYNFPTRAEFFPVMASLYGCREDWLRTGEGPMREEMMT